MEHDADHVVRAIANSTVKRQARKQNTTELVEPRRRSSMHWRPGTVVELLQETDHVKSIVLELSDWPGHRPGQYVDIRVTAPDGCQAQRSYSIASGPEDGYVVVTVERLQGCDVSLYLFDDLAAGDEIEMRGPLGSHFAWDPDNQQPVLLLAGGAGIVPFRSLLRHRIAINNAVPIRLLYSAPSKSEVIYRDELLQLAADNDVDIRMTLTRESPEHWNGDQGRVDRYAVGEISWAREDQPLIYMCGPIRFLETALIALIEEGHDPECMRIEPLRPWASYRRLTAASLTPALSGR
jgi:ferredoxin-NADP reductase